METNTDTEITNSFDKFYFQSENQIICDKQVPSITEDFSANHASVIDRYFTRYYFIKSGEDTAPYQILFHSNMVCMIALAPEHPALKDGIKSLSFNVGNFDRSKNSVKGKGKRGGMILQSDSTLAVITSTLGKSYRVPSCVRGKLIEVNTNLAEHLELFDTVKDFGENFLAIVLPKPDQCDGIKKELLTEAQYIEIKNM